jgi:hypothetical protein
MTGRQSIYIDSLATGLGWHNGTYAAAAILDRSISHIQRKGMTAAEASQVIGELKAGRTPQSAQ